MRDFFVIILVISLSFVLPPYLTFLVAGIYVVLAEKPVYLLLVLGVFLDVLYNYRLFVGIDIPLYTSIGILSLLLLPLISKNLMRQKI